MEVHANKVVPEVILDDEDEGNSAVPQVPEEANTVVPETVVDDSDEGNNSDEGNTAPNPYSYEGSFL